MAVGGQGAGKSSDVLREHLAQNSASYSTVNGTDSDDFRTMANIGPLTFKTSHVYDTTAYPTGATPDSWIANIRLQKTQTPAV